MSKPVVKDKKTFKKRVQIGRAFLYKRQDMKPEESWGIIIKRINEDGTVDKSQDGFMIPKTELQDLLSGRYSDAGVYLFEAAPQV